MASKKTLNAQNLESLGAPALAELLLEVSQGDAATKRRLRMALAGSQGASDLASEVRKRLTTIKRSHSFIDWHKQKAFTQDLEAQYQAIVGPIGKEEPKIALDLMWKFIALAGSVYERCDDSNGYIGDIFRAAVEDLAPLAEATDANPIALADQVFAAIMKNDYGEYDYLIPTLAKAIAYAAKYDWFLTALRFLTNWPALKEAAQLVIARAEELDGDHYESLNPAADALVAAHPLAATLILRSMIDFTMIKARSSRYGHAAKHLKECERLAEDINDFGSFETHEDYFARVSQENVRKTAFWKHF